jgi:AP-1-like transcription factor
MDFSNSNGQPIWDLSQVSSFSQLPDDDFLALLHKQFPSEQPATASFPLNGTTGFAVNPQSLNTDAAAEMSPPSDDSPSPIDADDGGSDDQPDGKRQKRKADDEDFDEGPSPKTQHTGTSSVFPPYS